MINQVPLHNYMKVGIVQFMAYPECMHGTGPVLETISSLAFDPFFEILEIGPIQSGSVRKQVIEVLKRARIQPYFDGQPLTLLAGLNLESEDKAERQKAIDAMKRGIDEAEEVGSFSCGVMSGKLTKDLDIPLAKRILAESLIELCAYAQPKGITMNIENFGHRKFGKQALIGSAKETVKLVEEVRKTMPNMGIITDLSHLPLMDEAPRQALETTKNCLSYTQLGNSSLDPYSPYYGDIHPYFGAPNTEYGVKGLTEFLQTLVDIGYLSPENRGVVSFEVKPLSGQSSEAIIAGSKRALQEAWREVKIGD